MKNFFAITALALTLPVAAAAQSERIITCTVADIANKVGVCGRVQMPQPPADVRIRVITRSAATTGGAALGTLSPTAVGLTFLGVAAIAAAAGGGGSSNGTN